MTESSKTSGVAQVLVQRLEQQRLPRALELKDRVDRGERLGTSDIEFLEQVFRDTTHIKPLVDAHPEWQDLAGRMLHLYKEITDRALENETAAADRSQGPSELPTA